MQIRVCALGLSSLTVLVAAIQGIDMTDQKTYIFHL